MKSLISSLKRVLVDNENQYKLQKIRWVILCKHQSLWDLKKGRKENDWLFSLSENPQKIEEYVEDIQVDGDCCKHIFFRRNGVLVVASHHHLSVNDEVNWEDCCSDATIDNFNDSKVVRLK